MNAYLDQFCPPSNYPMTETECEYRRISAQSIVVDAIQVLNHDELDKLSDVLDHIAYDRDYYMPERRAGWHR